MIESGIVKRVHDLMLENIKFEKGKNIWHSHWRHFKSDLKII